MRKAMITVGLTMLLAVTSFFAVSLVFAQVQTHRDADPNDRLARMLMSRLRDGVTFRMEDAYSDPWSAVEIISAGDMPTDGEWQAIRTFNASLAQLEAGQQLLVFWQDGEVTRMVRLTRDSGGMPWFAGEEAVVYRRAQAVFRATLLKNGEVDYYLCVPEGAEAAV